MTLNPFKAIMGGREMGINALPVLQGPDRAAIVVCAIMAVPQSIVIVLLGWGRSIKACIVVALFKY